MLSTVIASLVLTASSWTYLHYNENNRGPSQKVRQAMEEALSDANRYPDDDQEAMVKQIAAYHSVGVDQVVLANGLLSVLRNVAETFTGPGKNLITPSPSYEYLNGFAQNRGTTIVKVALRAVDYAHDLDRMLETINSSTAIVYICNPNNPTGSITPREEIDRFLARVPAHVYVVIDEAYHHYASGTKGYVSFLDKPSENPRVIVGRSFSKVYGLGGMRLGYVVSSPEVIAALQKNEGFDQCCVPALRAGSMALRDEEGMREAVQLNNEARSEFYRQCKARGLGWIPSHANFVMMETGGRSVDLIHSYFKKHQIRVGRKFMDTHIRITLGLPHEMELFWRVWDSQ